MEYKLVEFGIEVKEEGKEVAKSAKAGTRSGNRGQILGSNMHKKGRFLVSMSNPLSYEFPRGILRS